MKYERYIHTVLVPHVVVTAIIFWGMVIAWLFGWMPFNDALLVAVIGIAVLLVHGGIAAVWSVSAAANDKTQIDALKPSAPLDRPPTEPKPALTIDKPITEPKPALTIDKPVTEPKSSLNVDKPPVVLKRPTDDAPKIVTLAAVEPTVEAPKPAEASSESPLPAVEPTVEAPKPAEASSESPLPAVEPTVEAPKPAEASSESTLPTSDNPVTDSATPKQTP